MKNSPRQGQWAVSKNHTGMRLRRFVICFCPCRVE